MNLSDKYVENKILYMEESSYAESSKVAYLNLYMGHINLKEIDKGKDLLYFTNDEIRELSLSVTRLSIPSIKTIKSFITNYGMWGWRKGIDTKYDSHIIRGYFKETSSADWYINLDDFYIMCENLLYTTSIQSIIPLIIARYGITGEKLNHMRNLKWKDIDVDNLKVIIKDNEITTEYSIDKRFVEWLEKSKFYKGKYNKALNSGYVLAKTFGGSKIVNNTPNSYYAIYNKQNQAYEGTGIPRRNFKDLATSRQIDVLYTRNKDKGTIETKEIIEVMRIFGDNAVKKGTKVVKIRKALVKLKEDEAKISTTLENNMANKSRGWIQF